MINIAHVLEMVNVEIDGDFKVGADRFSYTKNPTVLLELLNTCLVELASDTRAFITSATHKLSDEEVNGNSSYSKRSTDKDINKKEFGWTDSSPDDQWNGSSLDRPLWSFVYYPANYIALKTMIVNGVDSQEQNTEAKPNTPIYSTRPEGWFVAIEADEIDKVKKLKQGDTIFAEYYYYPQVEKSDVTLKGNPMCNTALFHLMMHYVLGKDPYIEIPEDNVQNMMFGTSRWHKAKYDQIALKVKGIADAQHRKNEGTITPHYM